jgi:FemAB-related protein (PEP-CTERM system-associated)
MHATHMPDIRIIDRSDYDAWDHHILLYEQGGPYLTTAWKEAVESGYGHKAVYLAAYKANTIVGALPLIRIKPPLGKGCLVSLPFCDYGGILADENALPEALLCRAIGLAEEMQGPLEIRSPAPCPVLEKYPGFVNVTDKYRMILDLPGDSKQLWSGFKSKLRSQVKRAARDSLIARMGRQECLGDFYHVFSRNMRDLGSPVHSGKWIKSVFQAFGKKAKTMVVYKDNAPVGAGVILMHKNIATIPWASTLRAFNRLSPNMLLYWSLLEYAADAGYRYFDFGRSTPGEGTYAFKKQWGARPIKLFWYRHEPGYDVGKSKLKNENLRNSVEKVWRNLPVRLANVLGPQVRKYIDK